MIERQTFGTDFSSRFLLGAIFGFAIVFGIGAVLEGGYLLGSICVLVGLGAWLYYASLRVTVTSDKVVVRRYGFVIFSARRENVHATVGRGGSLKTHTALFLEAPGQKRVELLRTMFGKKALTQLAQLLNVQEEIPEGVY